jgi:hypothetical protein
MTARDLTGRAAEDTTVSRLLARYGVRFPGAVAAAVVLLQAALILAVALPHQLGVVARTISVDIVALPALVWTLLGLGVGLFDGWQIQEPGWSQRLARIAGHGVLGALAGAIAGGIAIVGGLLLVLLVGLAVEHAGLAL